MTDRPEDPDTPAPTPDDADTLSSGGLAETHAPEPVASSLIGTKIGGFSLKRIIGSGGMGTVYEAMQEQPRRRVAVKMMKRGITSKSALRRFEFESQLLGRLQHPGIAQVYEAGTHDDGSGGVPYFAMEYIANAMTLTEYAQDKKFGTRERLALFAKVCDAVQHGHLKGIVHRDLKPGNILVDSSGQPKIIDFGVARSTDSDMAVTTLQTDVGQLVGTLQYMSPEQCEADPGDIDARSDVYALGVVLYELLTGKPPYDVRKAAIHEAVRMVREEEPTKLSTIDRHLRGDIETIALKALEKERDRRYQSATALQEDIAHYLADEPIAARPPGAIDYLRRFARKHTAAAVAIVAVFGVLIVAVVAISIFAVEAGRQRKDAELSNIAFESAAAEARKQENIAKQAQAEAERQAHEAEQAKTVALRSAYYGNLHAASASLSEEDVAGAKKWLEKGKLALALSQLVASNADSVQSSRVHMPFEWRYLYARADDATATLRGHEQSVNSVTFSPDGQRLASAGADNTIRLWDIATGEELSVLRGHEQSVRSVTFSPDGKRLASGSNDSTIRLWDIASGEELSVLRGHETLVMSVTFSPDGQRLASAGADNTIRLWDIATGEELSVLRGHEQSVSSVTFSPDGKRLASAGGDNTIRLWDVATGDELSTLRRHVSFVNSVTFSPDGQRLASASWDDTIRLWDVATGDELSTLRGHEQGVLSVTFSPDGQKLASAGGDNTIRLWDVVTGDELSVLRGHEKRVNSVTFSSDGQKLASAGGDNTIRLWDVATGDELSTLRGHEQGVSSVTFSPDGQRLASASWDNTIQLWDVATGDELSVLRGHEKRVSSVTFSPDGQRLASASWDFTIRLWDVATGDELSTLRGHVSFVNSVTFSPDGQRLASASWDDTIRLWDVATGDELSTLRGHEQGVLSVTFSPDGQKLASAGGDNTIRLWDIATGEELSVLRGHEQSVRSVTFSPDGKRLASGSNDSTIRLWDIASGEELSVLRGHETLVMSVTFSPDGQRLASAGADNTIRLWDIATGEELSVLRGHLQRVSSVTFSSDGQRLASGGGDNTIRLWETRSRGQIAQDRRLAQEEMLRLTPLVETWIEKAGGDTEVLLAILERENKNRSSKEQATLRNVVLKSLQPQRDAKYLQRRIDAAWDYPETLNAIAWDAATSEDHAFFAAVSGDALRASQRSCELTDYEDAIYLGTFARVHFERGEFDEAIKWQELAMQHIQEDDGKGPDPEALGRYREAAKQDAQE